MEAPKVYVDAQGRKVVDVSEDYVLTHLNGRIGLFPKGDTTGEESPASIADTQDPALLINLLVSVMRISDKEAEKLVVGF